MLAKIGIKLKITPTKELNMRMHPHMALLGPRPIEKLNGEKKTFSSSPLPDLKLTTFGDHDWRAGFAGFASDLLNRLDDVYSGSHPSEDDVLSVQPGSLSRAKKELASVGVGAGIGHGENTGSGMLLDEVFIGEFVAVNRLASGAIPPGEVASLAHKPGDDTMELGSRVAEALLAGAERAEVFARLGTNIGVQRHDDASSRSSAHFHVEENILLRHFCRCVLSGSRNGLKSEKL